jgi:hypothetical protein
MIDYLYKFPDEETAQTVLADYYDSERGWKTGGQGYALDPVGLFFDVDATDPENPIITQLDGWHVNLRVLNDCPDPAVEYAVTPTNQRRVWL